MKIGGRESSERRYYLSRLPADAQRIENSMHWVLDVAFGEDQCRVRVENAAQNFACPTAHRHESAQARYRFEDRPEEPPP